MRDIITIQAGQCGNQSTDGAEPRRPHVRVVGADFWKQLCTEHGILPDGSLMDGSLDSNDHKDAFFYQVPRRTGPIVNRGSRMTITTSPALC